MKLQAAVIPPLPVMGSEAFVKPSHEELVQQYLNLVFHFSHRFLEKREDVEDVVHETFLRAFQAWPRFIYQSSGQLKSWLLTICRNLIHDRGRHLQWEVPVAVPQEQEHPGFEDAVLDADYRAGQLDVLRSGIDDLPPLEAELLRLRALEELSFAEIAGIFACPEGTVKMRYYRTLRRLKEVAR